MNNTYKQSGVDIELANNIINKVKPMIHSTHIPGVLNDIGSFAGLFSLAQEEIRDPVLVSGTDGVGTKLKIAHLLNSHDTIGIDLVAMCVNDIITCGAKPLFFLDYLATGKLEQEKPVRIIKGIIEGCKEAGCALLGGETAEMPGFYQKGEYDLSGFAVGVVERQNIINGKNILPGDQMIGIASSGVHSNGYSLIRKIFIDNQRVHLNQKIKPLKQTLGEELLVPTKIYVKVVLELISKYQLKGLAHITGGGFYENIPRILPSETMAVIEAKQWPKLPIFDIIQEKGRVSDLEMYHTFNMGIGLIAVVLAGQLESMLSTLRNNGVAAYRIGEIKAKEGQDRLIIN